MKKNEFVELTDDVNLENPYLYINNVNGFPFIEKFDKTILFPEIPRESSRVRGYKPGD